MMSAGMTSVISRAEAQTSAIRHQTLIASPRKARISPVGTARRVAPPAAPRSSPGAFPSARRSRSSSRRVIRTSCKETPTIAEFFKKNGYSTYYSGKWHLGDKPESYPIEHGFDEMKEFAAYYPGVYNYANTAWWAHPWFPKYNPQYWKEYQEIVNLYEWEGVVGQPAKKVAL